MTRALPILFVWAIRVQFPAQQLTTQTTHIIQGPAYRNCFRVDVRFLADGPQTNPENSADLKNLSAEDKKAPKTKKKENTHTQFWFTNPPPLQYITTAVDERFDGNDRRIKLKDDSMSQDDSSSDDEVVLARKSTPVAASHLTNTTNSTNPTNRSINMTNWLFGKII